MSREKIVRFPCAHQGCPEVGRYSYQNLADAKRLHQTYYGKWLCVRHSRPDELLTATNRRTVHEAASVERFTDRGNSIGYYWDHSGFVFGPGFKAFSKDFPVGTILRITAEIILPSVSDGVGRAPRPPLYSRESDNPSPTQPTGGDKTP